MLPHRCLFGRCISAMPTYKSHIIGQSMNKSMWFNGWLNYRQYPLDFKMVLYVLFNPFLHALLVMLFSQMISQIPTCDCTFTFNTYEYIEFLIDNNPNYAIILSILSLDTLSLMTVVIPLLVIKMILQRPFYKIQQYGCLSPDCRPTIGCGIH
jgi:hypothetical protein